MNKKVAIAALAALSAAGIASANVVTIVDTTAAGSTIDGTVGGAGDNYAGFGTGINTGFGNVWGAGAELHLDSDSAGNVYFGFVRGAGGFNDTAVIYIDSVSGGAADTTALEDTADGGRAAISGDGGGSQSEITFGASFRPDYAIAWDGNGNANLFQLTAGGNNSLTFTAGLGLVTNVGQGGEGKITMANLGLNPGDSFTYVATYLNPNNAFRSDEVMGQTALGGGNVGQNPVTLANEFNTFVSIPEPTTIALGAMGAIGLVIARRRRS